MSDQVVVDRRFRGPPTSANGGYVSGMAARWIDGPAEVTLRSPPPLDRPLRVARGDGRVELFDGDRLVASAGPAELGLEIPAPIALDEARRAAARYPWRDAHPYPTCFVCGPARERGDGLRIGPGPVDDGTRYAADWTPGADLAGPDGLVAPEFAWAALDCPSGIVTDLLGDVGRILLGRLAVELLAPLRAGEPYVVQAWPLARDGRKLHTASAIHAADGTPCAVARATWIEVASGA